MKYLKDLAFFLGIQVARDWKCKTIRLGQLKLYISKILKWFSMESCKPMSMPLETTSKLCKNIAPKAS
jgi:hypothetical protein